MTRKLYLLLIGAVISGVLVAACGGSNSTTTTTAATSSVAATTNTTTSSTPARTSSTPTTTSSTPTTSTSTIPSTSTSTSTTTTTTTSATVTTPSAPRQAVVAICKAEIQRFAIAALTADEKAQLNHLCDVAGSGNTAQIKAAEKQICVTVIKDSGLTGTALTVAQQSCNKVAPSG